MEEKYDGERLLITHIDSASRQVQQSRFLKEASTCGMMFQHRVLLREEVADEESWHHCVFDGELVYRNTSDDSIVSVCETGNRVANLYPTYIIFDVQYCNGEDVREKTLVERKRLLERMIVPTKYVQLSEWRDIDDWASVSSRFDEVCNRGGEGIMLKRKNEVYLANKRRWIKVKPLHIEGMRRDYDLFAHKLLRDKNGIFNIIQCGFYETFEDSESFVRVCGVSSGINGFERNRLQQLVDSRGFFRERQIVSVVADKRTIYGHLRHPVFERLRFDLGGGERAINDDLVRRWRRERV